MIHPSIENLAVPIKTLVPLENNPRKGDLGAIIASYRQFGQVKPIVVKTNGDGTSTVIVLLSIDVRFCRAGISSSSTVCSRSDYTANMAT
jgi:hypothetical protein